MRACGELRQSRQVLILHTEKPLTVVVFVSEVGTSAWGDGADSVPNGMAPTVGLEWYTVGRNCPTWTDGASCTCARGGRASRRGKSLPGACLSLGFSSSSCSSGRSRWRRRSGACCGRSCAAPRRCLPGQSFSPSCAASADGAAWGSGSGGLETKAAKHGVRRALGRVFCRTLGPAWQASRSQIPGAELLIRKGERVHGRTSRYTP